MIRCSVCVMDETCIPFVLFGKEGCNHCLGAKRRLEEDPLFSKDLATVVARIQQRAEGSFDCVIGVSGGLDSSYLLAKAVELGLRPLAVHMDNNWNSSMASSNLRNLLSKLNVPLVTVVTSWQKQKELQLAFLESDVVDVELLYDNALLEVCYQTAKKYGVKTILGGSNSATEGVEVPSSWIWKKFDGKNIRGIARNSRVTTKGYPIFTSLKWLWFEFILKIKWLSILDYFPEYSRPSALEYLGKNYGYEPYGSKHFENVFTRFYQGHILPVKFGIDKRKPHFSSEIISGALDRSQALKMLELPIYGEQVLLEMDFEYVSTKLGVSREYMEDYLGRPGRNHANYKYDIILAHILPTLMRTRRKLIRLLSIKI